MNGKTLQKNLDKIGDDILIKEIISKSNELLKIRNKKCKIYGSDCSNCPLNIFTNFCEVINNIIDVENEEV